MMAMSDECENLLRLAAALKNNLISFWRQAKNAAAPGFIRCAAILSIRLRKFQIVRFTTDIVDEYDYVIFGHGWEDNQDALLPGQFSRTSAAGVLPFTRRSLRKPVTLGHFFELNLCCTTLRRYVLYPVLACTRCSISTLNIVQDHPEGCRSWLSACDGAVCSVLSSTHRVNEQFTGNSRREWLGEKIFIVKAGTETERARVMIESHNQGRDTLLGRLRGVSLNEGSAAWRVTRFLRLQRATVLVSVWPRIIARYGLEHTFAWLVRRPRAWTLANVVLPFVPPLERRFLALTRGRNRSALTDDAWALEPDPEILNEWRKLLRRPGT